MICGGVFFLYWSFIPKKPELLPWVVMIFLHLCEIIFTFQIFLQKIALPYQALTQARSVYFPSNTSEKHTMHVQWIQPNQGMTSLGVRQRLMLMGTHWITYGEPAAQNAPLKKASIYWNKMFAINLSLLFFLSIFNSLPLAVLYSPKLNSAKEVACISRPRPEVARTRE